MTIHKRKSEELLDKCINKSEKIIYEMNCINKITIRYLELYLQYLYYKSVTDRLLRELLMGE